MKKKCLLILLILLLTVFPTMSLQASDAFISAPTSLIGISDQQRGSEIAESVWENHGIRCVVLFTEESCTEWELRQMIDRHSGEENALILAVSTGSRTYYIQPIRLNIPDSSFDRIESAAVEHLRTDDWSGAALAFLSACEYEFDLAWACGEEQNDVMGAEIVAGVIAIAVATVIVSVMAGKMKKTGAAKHANGYLAKDGFHLTMQRDVYLYSTVSKVRVESNSSGGHSGGSHGGGRGGHF